MLHNFTVPYLTSGHTDQLGLSPRGRSLQQLQAVMLVTSSTLNITSHRSICAGVGL